MNLPLWFSDLLLWSAQVALLTVVAAVLARLLHIRHPRALLVQWRALLVFGLLLPAFQPWHRQSFPGAVSRMPLASFSGAVPVSSPASPHGQLPGWSIMAEILGAALLLGIAVRLALFALGLLRLRQLRRGSQPVPPSAGCAGTLEKMQALVGASAEFRVSARVHSPVTFGVASPVILLPERFLRLGVESQATVACHELLHVRRRDWLHHAMEEMLRAALWFHPAILWLIARVRLAREQVVDLEVIRLTQARKSYLKALLEFTSRSRFAAVPAPPFLGERQFAERVSLMLKGVSMSRARLTASLSAVTCILAVAAIFAASIFPLKASPRRQNAPQAEAGATATSLATRPVVNANTIWTGQVKKGTMPVQVQSGGTLIPAGNSEKLVAEVLVSGDDEREVQLNQDALVRTAKGTINGHVESVGTADTNGNRWFDIGLDSSLPPGIGPNATVSAFITVGTLENVLYIERPAHLRGDAGTALFRIIDNGKEAVRVHVDLGRSNINAVQILSGLSAGDTVILSDMFPYYNRFTRIQIAR